MIAITAETSSATTIAGSRAPAVIDQVGGRVAADAQKPTPASEKTPLRMATWNE